MTVLKMNYKLLGDPNDKVKDKHKENYYCCTGCLLSIVISVIVILIWFPWIFFACRYDLRPVLYDNADKKITRIAFGSCASNLDPLDILRDVRADVFVFLGDNIYADTNSPVIMQMLYNRLSCKPSFQTLVKQTPYVLSTWDDHDYGWNDIGRGYGMKYDSKSIFLKFWNVDKSMGRDRPDGIYGSYKFDSKQGGVKVILMDLRFNNDIASESMLGDRQWAWLEAELSRSQQENVLTVLGSSTQFVIEANGFEAWINTPRERERLLSMINPNKTIVISGDVHWGEISVLNGLIEVTSSGISETDSNIKPNIYRLGSAFAVKNYGLIDLERHKVSLIGPGNVELISVGY